MQAPIAWYRQGPIRSLRSTICKCDKEAARRDDLQAMTAKHESTSGWQPIAHSTLDPRQLTLDALVRRCAAENDCFRRNQPSDPRYAYELFRRALVERNDDAWAALYELYCPLVEHWVRKNTAFEASGEPSEALVGEAFARFWQAIPRQALHAVPQRSGAAPISPALHQLCGDR